MGSFVWLEIPQIEFRVEVRAGSTPKELALKAAKIFRATWVILDRSVMISSCRSCRVLSAELLIKWKSTSNIKGVSKHDFFMLRKRR
jgi:hypothetical protein